MAKKYIDTVTGEMSEDLSGVAHLTLPSRKGGKLKGVVETTTPDNISDNPDYMEFKNRMNRLKYDPGHAVAEYSPDAVEFLGDTGFGSSRYDSEITTHAELDDLNNSRAIIQPWYDQLGAGVAKMGVLAGTTFLDGTVGVVAGLGNIITGGDDGRPEFSDFWNNPVSKALQSVNEWSESALPNYYTNEELKNDENGEWYKNVFSSNFLGDKVLKNFGFAIGAFYSGKLYTGLLSKAMTLSKARTAFKTAGTLGGDVLKGEQAVSALKSGNAVLAGEAIINEAVTAAKQIKTAPWIMKTVGGVTGALGEAKIEALQNSKDNMEYKKSLLDQNRENMLEQSQQEFESTIAALNPDAYYESAIDENGNHIKVLNKAARDLIQKDADIKYNQALAKIAEDAKDVGNMDFILNMGLLSLSNMWQFGKAYAGGYKTGKKVIGTVVKDVAKEGEEQVGRLASYTYKAPNKLKSIAKLASNPLVEGNEEMMQQSAAFASGYKYNSSDTFNKLGINDENSNKSLSVLQAMGKGMLDTYGSASQWEQFAIGALTGLVGVPQISLSRIKEGHLNPMAGGVWDDIKELRDNTKEEREKVETLNRRLADPKFQELYKGLTRHQTLDTAMTEALQNNDEFTFKNAEHQQMISDIITFHNTGRLQDFFDNIESISNVQASDIDEIKSQSVNKKTGKSIFDDTTKDEDVINHVKKQANKLKNVAESYKKIYDTLNTVYGEEFNKEVMSEMVYKISNIDHLENRFHEVFKDVKQKFNPYTDIFKHLTFKNQKGEDVSIVSLLDESPEIFLNNAIIEETKLDKSLVKNIDKFNKQSDKVDDKKRNNSNRGMSQSLQRLEKLKDLVDKHDEIFSTIPEFSKQIEDMAKIITLRKEFIDDHIKYTKNPNLLLDKINTEKDEEVKKSIDKKVKDLKDNLSKATTIADFKNIYDSHEDDKQKKDAVNELVESGHEVAKKFKELREFRKEVIENIHLNGNITPEQRTNAITVFNSRMNNSNSLEEVSNLSTLTADNVDDSLKVDESGQVIFTDEQLTNEVLPIIYNAIKKAIEGKKFKDSIKPVPVVTDEELAEREKTSPTTPTTTDKKTSITKPQEAPSGGATSSEEAKTSNESLNSNLTNEEQTNLPDKDKEEAPREYWNQAVHELDINEKKKKVFVFNKDSNPRFATLINYLEQKGAFKYVNSGKLSIDDEVGFMIDPTAFSELSVEEQAKLAGVIFMTTKDSDGNIQIIGVLPESNAHKFKGLKAFRQTLLKEFEEHQKNNPNTPFQSKSTVKVANIIPGNVMTTGTKFNSLKGMKGTENGVIFGIMQNGKIIAPRTDINDFIVDPKDGGNREGRLYMLVKGADNKYYPVLVVSRRFNAKEFNMNDAAIRETSRYKNIMRGINQLASAKTQEEVTAARNLIDEELYMGDYSIDYKEGGQLVIRKKQSGVKPVIINLYTNGFNPDAGEEMTDVGDDGVTTTAAPTEEDIKNNRLPVEHIANQIIDYIQTQEAYLQMSKNQLNDKNGYNESLIQDGLLAANIESAEMFGGWFQTSYIDDDGVEKQAKDNKEVSTPKVETTVANGTDTVIPGQLVTYKNGKYYVQEDGSILNDGGKPVLRMDNYTKALLNDLSWIKKNINDVSWRARHSGSVEIIDKDGKKKVIKGYSTPDGRVIDVSSGIPTYVSNTDAKIFIEALNKKAVAPKVEAKPVVTTSDSKSVIFNEPKDKFTNRFDLPDREKETLPAGTKGVRPGYYVHPTLGIIKTEIAPLMEFNGIQIYQASDGNGGVRAVFPNGFTRGLSANAETLIKAINNQSKDSILDMAQQPTILTKGERLDLSKVEEVKEEVKQPEVVETPKVIETPTKPKKELTPEQQAKLKAMAEREAKLKGQGTNTQESKEKEFAEQSKKLFPDKENSGNNEKNSVKSLDNSNKKLTFAELEIKKADIERRRQEEIDEANAKYQPNIDKYKKMAEGELSRLGKVQRVTSNALDSNEGGLYLAKERINAKYDAELAKLNSNNENKFNFNSLEKDILEAVSKVFTESEWNSLTKEEQEEKIQCFKF